MRVIPLGLCHCGCGGHTRIPIENNRSKGEQKGVPLRFIRGHHRRLLTPQTLGPNPSGLCLCGCGEMTPIASKSNVGMGHVKGQPMSYLAGHKHKEAAEVVFHEEDRGYKTPCWIFDLFKNPAGYGRLKRKGKTYQAHRVLYEKRRGPIPAGLELDHLCFVTSCVNPDHMEPVTSIVNRQRQRRQRRRTA
jgi:hypothetical protein